MDDQGKGSDFLKNIGKNAARFIGGFFKTKIKFAIIIILVFVLIAALFWGVIDGAFEKLSEVASGLKDSVVVEDKNIIIPEDFKEEIMKRLEAVGLNASELNLGGNIEYLSNWMEAEIVTSYPYMGGDGLQGVITVQSRNTDGTTTDLTYTELENMENMLANGDANAKNYFSTSGSNMITAKTVYASDGTTSIQRNEFNYEMMVAAYSTPFEFFVALCLITQSPEFVNELANYTKNTTIEITLLESLTTTTTTTNVAGKQTTMTYKTENGVRVDGSETETTTDYAEDPIVEVSYISSVTPIVTEARTLFVEKTVEPIYTDRVQDAEPILTDLEDRIGNLELIDTETTGTGNNQVVTRTYQRVSITDLVQTVNISTHYQTWQSGTNDVRDNTDAFLSYIVNETGELPSASAGSQPEEEVDLSQVTGFARTILENAAECKQYVANNGFTYGATGNIPITSTGGTVDCSGFVSWVLYEAGYRATFGGHQWNVSRFESNPLGWQEITSFDAIQPGDLIIMNDDKGNYAGHIQIYAGNGLYYNCGYTGAIEKAGATKSTRTEKDFNLALRPSSPSQDEINGTASTNTSEEKDVIVEGIYILYDVPGSSAPLSPRENLVTGAELLFKLLGSNERTQIYETIMRYILYRLTGHNYGVTELDLSLFSGASFTGVSGSGSAFLDFLKAWEGTRTDSEGHYMVADDGVGIPTVGFGVALKYNVERFAAKGVTGVETWQIGDNCYYDHGVDNSIIDSIMMEEINDSRNEVKKATEACVPPLNQQQIDALVAIKYQYGNIGNFVQMWNQYGNTDALRENVQAYRSGGGLGQHYFKTNPSVGRAEANWKLFHEGIYVDKSGNQIIGISGSEEANELQLKIVAVAQNSAAYGISARGGYCLAWVNDVYEAAGVAVERKCCAYCSGYNFGVSKDFSIIPVGAAVYGESFTQAGRIYGHVAIYIGNGQVVDNIGYVRTTSLENWISSYPDGCWGWTSSTPVNPAYPVTKGLIHAGRH